MSTEAVKKRLLLSTSVLNIPLDRTPQETKVKEVCAAAKLLRNRLLREHATVVEKIEQLRQKQLYDDDTDDDENEEFCYNENKLVQKENLNSSTLPASAEQTCRSEFMFLADLQVAERIVIPILLAHGIRFVENLLPQLLKLLIALLLPVPRFSAQETQQKDLLTRIKVRCGTDQFFALMVQIVADIATNRASGKASQKDFSLLDIVLTTISHVLEGHPRDMTTVAGSFCRSQGVELLLVVVSQNYAKVKLPCVRNTDAPCLSSLKSESTTNSSNLEIHDANRQNVVKEANLVLSQEIESNCAIQLPAAKKVVVLNEDSTSGEDEEEGDIDSGEDFIAKASSALARQFEQRVKDFFESEQQLWKWNVLVIKSLSNVLSCVLPIELAQLSISNGLSLSSSQQLNIPFHDSEQLRACKQESDKWRCIARGRHGAMSSNSILVRPDVKRTYSGVRNNEDGHGDAKQRVGGRAIGSVSTLLSTKRKDPLEAMKDIDFRKRGRFVGGMFQGTAPFSDIPLPTKIQLSQQIRSFLCFGFEPLSVMTWARFESVIQSVDQSTKEYKEMIAGYRNSDETAEMTSPLEASVYESFSNVLAYVKTATSFLAYIRETARIMKDENIPFTSSPFQQQWQSVSSIISLGHLEDGFAMLRSFLQCKDLRQRLDMIVVVQYLSEMLLVLTLLLEGDLIQDPAVAVAAHALVSSILYKEMNIKAFFDLISVCTGNKKLGVAHAQALTLLIYAVFQLMDHCSYKGRLLLMKRTTHNHHQNKVSGAVDLDAVSKYELQYMQDETPLEATRTIGDEANGIEESFGNQISEPLTGLCEKNYDKGMSDSNLKSSAELYAVSVDDDRVSNSVKATPPISVDRANCETEAVGGLSMSTAIAHQANDTSNNNGVDNSARETSCVASEAYPDSVASSNFTASSDLTLEREVTTSSYFHRLATPKHMNIVKVALQHWRLNDADVNLGLTYLMKRLVEEGCESVFFNVNFLLVIRDVIVNGKRSHRPLYEVCDELAWNFFNPSPAKVADERARTFLDVDELPMVSGAQSFLGFEVSLRCARSLFNFGSTDYRILEEKALPSLMDYTLLELPEGTSIYSSVSDTSFEKKNVVKAVKFEGGSVNGAVPEVREETLTCESNQGYVSDKGDGATRKRERQPPEYERQSVEVVKTSRTKRKCMEEIGG